MLKEWEVEGYLIDHPVDLFYLTGMHFSLGRLFVTPKEAVLFVDGRYLQAAQNSREVKAVLTSREAVKRFGKKMKRIGFDSETTTVEQYERLKEIFGVKLKAVPSPLQELRVLKDKREQSRLVKSARLLWKGFKQIHRLLKVGISEERVAMEFEIYCRKNGASSLAFEPIIAFGKNSAMPHYRAGKTKLKRGDLVLVDIGVVVDGYASDMTRVIHFGKIDARLKKIERVVKAAHAAALKLCRPGTLIGKLDEAARKVMRRAGMESLFVHSLGHGIGLETHEYPRIKFDAADKGVVLAAGMAITIEPGLYLPGVGGIRHEDTILITETGYKNLYV